ncbi:MAG: PAS domain-containing protein [Fibrobacteres bacterium]|nr:PAS domain-containing protein [Fibrobacterota bacterium]
MSAYIFSYIHFLSAILFFILALVTIYQNHRALINRVCCIILISFGIWSSGQIFVHMPEISYAGARLAENISALGWINFSGIFLIFCLVFTEKRRYIKFVIVPIMLIQSIFLFAQWNDLLHLNSTHIRYGWVGKMHEITGVLFLLYYSTLVFIGLLLLYRYRASTNDLMKKRQATIFIISAVTALILSTITNVLLPRMNLHAFPPFGDVITLFWASGVAYATVKYSFLSITPTTAVDSIVESMADCLILLSTDLKIAFINRATEETLHLNKDDIQGKDFATFIYDKNNTLLSKIVKLETVRNQQTNFKTPIGITMPVNLSCAPIAGAGFACIIRDATSQVQYQEVLESTVRQRTKDLQKSNEDLKNHIEELNTTKAQLSQAQKLESIGQLAGGVAHDFNNMLSVVSGFSQLIIKDNGKDKEKINGYVERIIEITTRSSQLVSHLMDFARKKKMEMSQISFHPLVQKTSEILSHTLSSSISIITKLNAEKDTIKGEPSQLQNVILNMAINARDAMPKGGVFTLCTQSVAVGDNRDSMLKKGEYLKFIITDTGTGMDEETCKRIFEPFFTTKDPGKGTGLGLSSVYGIIKQHNGYIDVKSEKGKGTEFYIYFPLL